MRSALFVTLTLSIVALAGCSEAPPSGEFSSSGSALNVEANIGSAVFEVFNDPTANPVTGQAGQECLADHIPEDPTNTGNDPVAAQRCTYPSTSISAHIMSLPYEGDWKLGLIDTAGVNSNGPQTAPDAGSAGMYDWNYTSDADEREMFDAVGLFLGDKLIATAGLSQGSTFDIVPALTGISYSAAHDGKTLTVTVSGIDETAGYSFTGWLVTVDETGAKSHDDQFSIAGNGEVVFDAPMDIADYQEFHIHVSGTSLNAATGTIA